METVQHSADSIFRTKRGPHLLHERYEINCIFRSTSSSGNTWVFPINIHTLESPSIHEFDQGSNESRTIRRRTTHIRPGGESWARVIEIEASDRNPRLKLWCLECGELCIQHSIGRIGWCNFEAYRIYGCERQEEVCQAVNINLRGLDAVTGSIADI